MLKLFIDRPVLATVISIILIILGVLGLQNLPITQYPQIAPPTVVVRANYPGASAETVLESVVIPIEEEINGVEGMDYMTSTSSNNGSAEITVYFGQEVDPDIAAINVQNRVARANPLLPSEVLQSGIITQKRESGALMYLSVYSNSNNIDAKFIQNYLNINVSPVLQRINGVGEVSVFGDKSYAMRIWLDPEKLAFYGLQPADIIAALNEQSIEAAPGTLGQNIGATFEYVLRYKGRYTNEEDFKNIILKAPNDDRYLRLSDVANIELGATSYRNISRTNGKPSVNFGIFQSPGSNARAVIAEIRTKLTDLKADFPEGMDYSINYNINEFLSASIKNLLITFCIAFVLVFVVVYLFLQDFRATLIPAIAVPVSIVGTFFFLNLLGYSINLLTLFALILAIGIVVDDAIVVTEAVKSKMEEGEKDARKASIKAIREIVGALIATTLVMAAVFIPVTFLTGPVGVFYEQFGVTLITAIVISSINALTLSPALSALFLKPENKDDKNNSKHLLDRFFSGFNSGFSSFQKKYVSAVGWFGKHRWLAGIVILTAAAGIYFINTLIPRGFVPTEDRNILFVNIKLPPGASLDRTFQITEEFAKKAGQVKGISNISVSAGSNFFSGAGGSYALGFIGLDNWDKRQADSLSVEALSEKLFGIAATIPDAEMVFFQPSQIPGFGSSGGFALNILNQKDASLSAMEKTSNAYIGKLMQQPAVKFAQSSFSTKFPQYRLNLDIPKIKAAQLSTSAVLETLQGYIGGIYAANFNKYGKQYRVYVQALPQDREKKADLSTMYVRNAMGKTAPMTEFVSLERTYGPQSISRFNLFPSVGINGQTMPEYSSGDAIGTIQELASELPQGYGLGFGSLTREQIKAKGQLLLIFGLSLVFMYFFLSAQYESYIIPFAVILSLPLGMLGSYLFTWMFGLQNNIYFQIALIMLIGLLAKNAILIVEFGIQKRKEGKSVYESGLEASKIRLRPVIMTSVAFIAGMLPLILSSGVGARGNRSVGVGAAGGLLVGTLLLIFVVPVLFMIFQELHEKAVHLSQKSNHKKKLYGKEEEDV